MGTIRVRAPDGVTGTWDDSKPLPDGFTTLESQQEQSRPGAIESAGKGLLQGATAGFSDEASAFAGAVMQKLFTEDPESFGKLYDRFKAGELASLKIARESNPVAYGVGQVAGGIASAALPAGAAGRAAGIAKALAPSTVKGMIASGAAQGAAIGLGESEADLAGGDVLGAARDAAIGGVGGAIGGTIGAGIGSTVKKLGTYGVKGAAKQAGVEARAASGGMVADPSGQTMGEFAAQTAELQGKSVARGIGEVPFTPSKATGSRKLALVESYERQNQATMDAAQALKIKGDRAVEKNLNALVDDIASDPSKLNRKDVGSQVVGEIENYTDRLRRLRSEDVGPLYQAAEQAAGGKRVIPTTATKDAAKSILDEYAAAPKDVIAQVKDALSAIDKLGTSTGRVSIADAQKLRSTFGKYMRGELSMSQQLDRAAQARMARTVLSAIDQDLDQAAEGIASKEAVGLLRQANAKWREHTANIDSVVTDAVDRIFKSGQGGTTDTIAKKILAGSPEDVRGVFALLNKANPEVAANTRAQLLEDIFVGAGKAMRNAEGDAANLTIIKPETAYRKLIDPEVNAKLMAAFDGDGKAKAALSEATQWLRRAGFGPNLAGSQTEPLIGVAASKAADTAASIAGPQIQGLRKLLGGMLSNEKAQARAFSTPEGLRIFNEAMRLGDSAGKGQEISQNAVAKLFTQASTLGLVPNKE